MNSSNNSRAENTSMEPKGRPVPEAPQTPENQVQPEQQLSKTTASEVSYSCPCCIAREKVLASRGER
ncbi:MAG: hypothetical protein ACJZ8Y_07675 [Pirellulaceae bacterium]